jgi:hypothetical protein
MEHDEMATPDSTPARSKRDWTFEGVYAVLLVVVVLLVLSPVLRRSGWPLNRGSTAPLLLVQMYAAHISHLDLFPIWSSTDGIGLGSPVLLFYHRTFYYLAGLVLAVTGIGLKSAVVLTLAGFLVIGAYGMRRAIGIVSDSRVIRSVGSIGFLFTNYAFTDWLDPRGDLAEFSAMMLVPWLLVWCLDLVSTGRASFLIVPMIFLLVNTHSAVALFSVFAIVLALAVFFGRSGWSGLRALVPKLGLLAVATTVLVAPLLVAEYRFLGQYDPQIKNTAYGYESSHQFVGFASYFFDGAHRWLSRDTRNFVQIDFAIWIPLAVAVVVLIHLWVRRNPSDHDVSSVPRGPTTAFLVVSFLFFLLLQLRESLFVYRLVAPLQVINFPWRMLSFITPLGILLVAVAADRAVRHFRVHRAIRWGLAAGWLASLALLSPITTGVGYDYGFVSAGSGQFATMLVFLAPGRIDYNTFHGFFLGIGNGALYGVFLPKVVGNGGGEVSDDDLLYQRITAHPPGGQSLSQVPCSISSPSRAPFETLALHYRITCSGATRLALPVSINPSSAVYVRGPGARLRRIPYVAVPGDPRMVIDVRGPGTEQVVVHLPTLWGVLSGS